MNKYIAVGIIVIAILVAGYFIISNSTKKTDTIPQVTMVLQKDDQSLPASQTINKQASFAIFTNGTFRVFTASMYHNLSDNVYIEASNPNIVKVKKAGTTWDNFFSTLPFKLTHDCLTTGTKETFCNGSNGTLKFYLNGERKERVLDQEIRSGDKLLISYGDESYEAIRPASLNSLWIKSL